MKPVKVLHILDVEKEAFYFSNLADYTNPTEAEYSFITFAPEGDFTASIRQRGLRVYALGAVRKSQLPNAARKIWSILKEENPDIVHAHLLNPAIIGLNLAKLQKRKTVLTRHHSDAIHLLPSRLKRSFYLTLEFNNNRRADHIIAPSRMVRECVVAWEGTPADKVSVIPYGQSGARFAAITPEIAAAKRAELSMDKQLSLVCVSRLFHRKGHEYLFSALAPLLKEGLAVKLYLAGGGEHEKTLKALVERLGIVDNIEFLGWRKDVLEIIAASDIVVHPSLEDALSQSLIESLMLSKPIVATDISGAADTLGDGQYGRLVPPANAAAIETALREIIGDLPRARETARRGRAYLLDYMDAGRVAREYLKIYTKVLSR
jgi:glycosyltransferase involved in cell wall biosynthesis